MQVGLTERVVTDKVAPMAKDKSVLFVCTGNTCRSPMAEGLFKKAVAERSDFQVASAGVAAYPGSSMSVETRDVLAGRDAEIEGFASQPVSQALVADATHVFAMTEGHLSALLAQFPEHEDKFYLVCEFVAATERVGLNVPDPIGMGPAAYQEVAHTLDVAIPTLIAFIDQTWTAHEPDGSSPI